jgi:hypothetical protein
MTAEQSAEQTGKAEAVTARLVRAVTWPGGKDVDWECGSAGGQLTVTLMLSARR